MVLVPVVNLDGRARVPIQMEAFRGRSNHVHEYFNCGAWPDGSLIGWPGVKRHIPLDFAQTQFPGGYPNDAGVNLMHDDFFGARQPETQALLDFVARERPDLLLNMHTGVAPRDYYARMHRPFTEPGLAETFDALYTLVHTALTRAGLQGSPDEAVEADPARAPRSIYNLDAVLGLHSGVLSVVLESPSHGYAGTNRQGVEARHSPDALLDTQLIAHAEAMTFLVESGGRAGWTPDA